MQRELKIRIDDIPDIDERPLKIGAIKGKRATYRYIYFNQPAGEVLKITKKPEGTFKTVIRARDGKFDIISSDRVDNENKLLREFTNKFGIKKEIVNQRLFFVLDDDKLSLNNIRDVGRFLIIEGKNPSTEIIDRLGIKNPEVITKSFDEL